ncbi:MAG: hypothetical protein R3277_03650 [Brumimicrobium sp.]|nr:hypothetical protein [Brumimicrobium sp.]
MKLLNTFLILFILSFFTSCSGSKNTIDQAMSDEMKMEVAYIDNQMPGPDKDLENSRYISFTVIPGPGKLAHNWKPVSLWAGKDDNSVETKIFDDMEFKGKGEPVYRNTSRTGFAELPSTIDVKVILVNEDGTMIELTRKDVVMEVVY